MTIKDKTAAAVPKTPLTVKKKSRFGEIWSRFRRNKIAMLGLFIFVCIVLMMFCADLIVPYDVTITNVVLERNQSPSAEHWLGTDNFGRDIFARIVHGSRNSLMVGFVGMFFGVAIGSVLGSVSGFYGGKIDAVIMRVLDTVACIPYMLLVLTIVVALGPSLINTVVAMIITMIPFYTRIVRSAILGVVDMDYIEAARSCGTPDHQIILRHILPNAIGPIIVQATMSIGSMIIWGSSVSFLGMGIQPPAPEWGAMLSEAKKYILDYPYMVLFPGLAIALTAFSLNLMGDGLRDALDPKLKD